MSTKLADKPSEVHATTKQSYMRWLLPRVLVAAGMIPTIVGLIVWASNQVILWTGGVGLAEPGKFLGLSAICFVGAFFGFLWTKDGKGTMTWATLSVLVTGAGLMMVVP